MKFGDLTLKQITDLTLSVEAYLKGTKGFQEYAKAHIVPATSDKDIYHISWCAWDTFSHKGVTHDERQGYKYSLATHKIVFNLTDDYNVDELWRGLEAVASLERRELKWLAFRAGKLGHTLESLETDVGKSVRAELEAVMAKTANLLADEKILQ